MAGGLIQLVAYGTQDIFLSTDPQITFFKIVYRRHTNFSTEVIPQTFIHDPDFGKRVTCILSRDGDLIRKVHVVATLPRIPQFVDENQNIDQIAKFAWVRKIGYVLIKTVEIEIGGELIDRQYGEWLNIWNELTVPSNQNIAKMIGDVKILTDFSNGKEVYQLFIPLQFWFNRIPGLALPIVSLQYNHIKINVEINDLNNCYILSPTHTINVDNDFVNFEQYEYIQQTVNGVTSLAKFIYFDIINRVLYLERISNNGFLSVTVTDPSLIQTESQQKAILYQEDANGNLVNAQYLIVGMKTEFQAMPSINSSESIYKNNSIDFSSITLKDCFLLVEYIYLDDEERVRFSQARHEYLIEQVFFNGADTIDGLNQSFKIGFTQPCKELIWVTQMALAYNQRNNDWFNYTDSMIRNELGILTGKSLILQETIMFNGYERLTYRDGDYFGRLQIYQSHRHNPSCEGINVYNFGFHPEKHQPSGTANLSKIDNLRLRLSVSNIINFNFVASLRVYGLMYNILRVANGISGLVFAIDQVI